MKLVIIFKPGTSKLTASLVRVRTFDRYGINIEKIITVEDKEEDNDGTPLRKYT